MSQVASLLPFATQLDPTEEPPTSVDPLGTLQGAERLADVLLPGFTVRMWRPRLVTFATLAAEVASRASQMIGRDDLHIPARLAFERLYVSAVVRAERDDPKTFAGSTRSLPGQTLAAAALDAGEPLGPSNFLRGQGVNGPSGIMVRMARTLGLVDDRWFPAANSTRLLAAWAEDRKLGGLLEEPGSKRTGAVWMERVVKHTVAHLTKSEWPGPNQQIWMALADALRPDRASAGERTELGKFLDAESVRRRMLELLVDSADAYDASGWRGEAERTVLLDHVRCDLGRDPVDRLIRAVLAAASAYESAVALLEQAFDALRWGLRGSGHASIAKLVAIPEVGRVLTRTCSHLPRATRQLERAAALLRAEPNLGEDQKALTPSLMTIRDVANAATTPTQLVSALLERHEEVQRLKRKGVWIDRGERLTLMPGFGFGGEDPPVYEGAFRHPFRVQNAFAFLSGLKRANVGAADGEV